MNQSRPPTRHRQDTCTVMVTVYHKNTARELTECLDSLAAQTRPAEQILIVIDGPVGGDLHRVIDDFRDHHPETTVVALPDNRGSGPASRQGLDHVTGTWLARLDADDIACPERLATQLEFLARHPGISVLGTALAEFEGDTGHVVGIRRLAENHPDIVRYATINSPVNHPSCMMRTSAVKDVGGYRDVPKMEDYDLFVRLIAGGWRLHNLPEPLTYFRMSPEVHSRRTGTDVMASEWAMQKTLVDSGLIGPVRAGVNLVARTGYRLLPKKLLKHAYTALFRR
ncbi:glycosyltransferase [Corynebacterium mendelii]|uniref:Glycosyltransferase n=1 Tax=Corynebacterium mendelii TaxID=2765362 RepID=A0A939E157_9CORY|nr:glycosyltransferase [Corynebacterium mendelii]MBN9643801.1 glycosyltransferase [Corynebacterium mendelii]